MKKNSFKNIGINIILLGIVSFLNDASSEMITPILPLFIMSLGGTGVILGLIGGLRDSISSLLKVICGYWSDKTGKRKIFVFSGYITSAVFKLLLSFSTIWQHVLLFSGLERVGKGIRTAPRDAIIADSMPEKRGKGFGIHRALDTAGAIIGSILAFILIWYGALNFNIIILIAACIAFLSFIPLLFVKEIKRKKQDITFKISIKTIPKPLKLFLIVSIVFSLSNFSYMFFISKTQTLFPKEMTIAGPIMLYIVFNIFYAGLAIPFGLLSDKIGRKKVLLIGYLLFSVTMAGFALFSSIPMFIVLFALYGIVYAIVDGNQRAFVSDLSPENLRSTSLGIYHTLVGLVALPSSIIAGLIWDIISPEMTFVFGMFFSLTASILLLTLINSRDEKL
ncbi:MAG: MFS transporter [Thermoplasmata archaeon]|nr:MAG: MFS transporter [Thermoplasmata archaeon]